jgi:hypothetical protein
VTQLSGNAAAPRLHASSSNPSILPTLAILLVATGFALAMSSEPYREAVRPDQNDHSVNSH